MVDKLSNIPITQINPNPYQPRQQFSEEELAELTQSIKENGLIQPIIVRQSPLAGYDLVAGERRFRASQAAGLSHIPAIIKEMTDEDSMKQAIIENLQRSDLNPIEEALAYQHLLKKLGLTHEDIAKVMGKSRPYISNSLRLLNLSDTTKKALVDQAISPGHARLLLSLSKEDEEQWLDRILNHSLSVRDLENQLKPRKEKTRQSINPFIKEQENFLKQKLGLDCQIQLTSTNKGKVTINFSSLDDFHNLIHKLT